MRKVIILAIASLIFISCESITGIEETNETNSVQIEYLESYFLGKTIQDNKRFDLYFKDGKMHYMHFVFPGGQAGDFFYRVEGDKIFVDKDSAKVDNSQFEFMKINYLDKDSMNATWNQLQLEIGFKRLKEESK